MKTITYKSLYTKCLWFDYCSIPEQVEKGRLSKKWLDNFCNIREPQCIRYEMEHYGKYIPDNLLPEGCYFSHI